MTIIDLRCRPAFLHDFFGATPGSPEFETPGGSTAASAPARTMPISPGR